MIWRRVWYLVYGNLQGGVIHHTSAISLTVTSSTFLDNLSEVSPLSTVSPMSPRIASVG